MTRTQPNSSWTARPQLGQDVMDIILTGFWDDTKLWEDNKFWVDGGQGSGSTWEARVQPNSTWS